MPFRSELKFKLTRETQEKYNRDFNTYLKLIRKQLIKPNHTLFIKLANVINNAIETAYKAKLTEYRKIILNNKEIYLNYRYINI